jgi:integrase
MRGSIIRRGRTWSAVFDEPRTDGKRKQRWRGGFKTRKEAERFLAETVGRLSRGDYVEPSAMTVEGFLTDRWLPAVRGSLRPSTYASYEMVVRTRVVPRLGHVPLQRLDAGMLQALYAELGERLSPRSAELTHATIRKALGDAERWGLVQRNAAAHAVAPRRQTRPPRVWSREQLRTFLASVRDERLYPLWLLLATTGMRRGEVCGLQWSALDLDGASLSVRETLTMVDGMPERSEPKTVAGRRRMALDAATVEALSGFRRRRAKERMQLGLGRIPDDEPLCVYPDGTPIRPDVLSRLFERRVKAAGLPRLSLHGVRHTYATLALEAGVHPRVVQQRLGHSHIAITLGTYSHVTIGMDEQAAEAVAALVLAPR